MFNTTERVKGSMKNVTGSAKILHFCTKTEINFIAQATLKNYLCSVFIVPCELVCFSVGYFADPVMS